MKAKADHQDVHRKLARSLQDFWDEYAGIRPTRVQVVSGEGAIAVWLEEILSPAEQQMAGTEDGGRMLQELERRILEQARPELQRLVEGAAGQQSTMAEVHLDWQNRGVLGFFRLG